MRRAFSYLEAVWTMGLVALIFFLFTELLHDGLGVLRASDTQQRVLQAGTIGLDRLTCELREAIAITNPAVPTSGAGVDDLAFIKIDSSRSDRLPPAFSVPPDGYSYRPLASQYQLLVRYSLRNTDLVRDIGPVSGPPQSTIVVAQNVVGLSVSRPASPLPALPPRQVIVRLSVIRDKSVQPLSAQVYCPGVSR